MRVNTVSVNILEYESFFWSGTNCY